MEIDHEMTNDEVRDDLRHAIAALRGLGATSIGVTEFCLGGRISYRVAQWADELGLGAAVLFYGDYATQLDELHYPAVLLFAGKDEYITRESVEAVRECHGDIVHVYPDNGLAFMRDGDPSFEPVDAADTWARLIHFFGEHLAPA